jgi:Protein of unknown function (DUF4012)
VPKATDATPGNGRAKAIGRRSLLVVVVLAALALGWIAITGLMAKHDAEAVRTELPTLKSDLTQGNETAAAQLETRMRHQASAAHSRTTGPAWWAVSKVPDVGQPAVTFRGLTAAIDQLANSALPSALRAGQLLDPHELRSGPDQIDPARLGQSAAPLAQAVQASGVVIAQAQALPASTWLGTINSSRTLLIQDVTRLRNGLASLSTAARLLPEPLGQTGIRTYFLAFETDAEARGLGGLPGAYAILQANDGHLSFLRFGSDTDLFGARSHVKLGADFTSEYGNTFAPQGNIGNSDPSPNFPYAAQIWMSMWQDTFHQHLDGAIATDPTALSYLLGATGPVTLADGTSLNQSNAVAFFENGVYAKFGSSDAARKTYQVDAARAVATDVLHQPSGDFLASATALQRAADEGRLLVYTSDPTVEAALQPEPVGGVLPQTTRPFLDVVINNGGGNKLDYYLDRTVAYQRASCTAPKATVTVTLHNDAPTSGLPPTVAGLEAEGHPGRAGDNTEIVSLFGTDHSGVTHATLDGKTAFISVGQELGHPVTTTNVDLKPGQTRTLIFYVHEPPATAPLLALRQPLVRPLQQTISEPRCG